MLIACLANEEIHMAQLILHFAHNAGRIELEKTLFRSSAGEEFIAVRGKTAGAYGCIGSFQWTPAVKALCAFFVQALRRNSIKEQTSGPMISGTRGSLASSLDYAINKEPQWLCDMFGLDATGKTNLRRLIFRSNTNIKRPGPVSLSLNPSALPAENITVLLDSIPIENESVLDAILSALVDESSQSFQLLQSRTFDLVALANSKNIHPMATAGAITPNDVAPVYA